MRLEKERIVDSNGRVVELDDDPMLDQAGPSQRQGNATGLDGGGNAEGDATHLRPDRRSASRRSGDGKANKSRSITPEYAGMKERRAK